MGKAVLPRKVTLTVKFADDEHVTFVYAETFAPGEEALTANAIRSLRSLIHPGVRMIQPNPLTVRMSGTVPFVVLGDLMVGEWLSWSTLGNASMSTIIKAIGRALHGTRPGRVKLRDVIVSATSDMAEKPDNDPVAVR